jgi:hypothetical protein
VTADASRECPRPLKLGSLHVTDAAVAVQSSGLPAEADIIDSSWEQSSCSSRQHRRQLAHQRHRGPINSRYVISPDSDEIHSSTQEASQGTKPSR